MVARPVDEIGYDQEVAREAHFHDGFDFVLKTIGIARTLLIAFGRVRIKFCEALLQSRSRLFAKIRFDCHTFRYRKIRQFRFAQREFKMATLRNFDRVLDRFRNIGEQRDHVRARFEILIGGEIVRAAFVAQHLAARNAHARFVGFEIVSVHELNRMRRDDREIALCGKP